MDDADSLFIKNFYNNLTEGPLEPDSKFYEPIYDAYADDPDYIAPIDQVFNRINLSRDVGESLHFFSGFRGSGKTTELKRLKKHLESQGFTVLFANALDYVNPGAPLDISDLLITLAGAFSDQIESIIGRDALQSSYWDRLVQFLKHIKITEASLELKALPPYDVIGASVKAELKDSPTFRERIQTGLSTHIAQLNAEARKFFQDGVQAVKKSTQDKPVVFIFDSLEQLRGTRSNEMEVLQSVESIFRNHLEKLELPYLHVVYTVPPWLKFVLPGVTEVVTIPSVRLWKNTPDRKPFDDGIERIRSLIRRRLDGNQGWIRFFGQNSKAADDLILMSGGHFRDLIRMLRFMISSLKNLPVSETLMQRSIGNLRTQYTPINTTDATWLWDIAQTRHADYKAEDVDRLARLLDLHLALFLMNGEAWYDVHPIILDEVKRIAESQQKQTPSPNS